ncbi:cold shock protein 2 isoform X1 [Ricinus communis]|uniref:cold shock protein 2 isoform X1 n=1 Tax=Ricinus communis TaxID=3988 RepID=UPI00201AB6CD|nr:cold shock protein 2 isoform X1 [Ricinus communis]
MEKIGTWMATSATPSKQEDIKFDASQYEFFGKNVMEHELGDLDSPSEKAEDKDLLLSEKHEGKNKVISSSCINDLASSFTKLNKTSEPRRAKALTKGLSSPMGSLNNKRARGILIWYSNEKGYGFIKPNGGGVDVFVHSSSLKSNGHIHLGAGMPLEYETIISNAGKLQAINVTAPKGKLLQDSRKVGCGVVSTKKSNMGASHLAKHSCVVAKSGAWHGTQLNYTLWEASTRFVKCGGWSGFAWCYYCGKVGHFFHS